MVVATLKLSTGEIVKECFNNWKDFNNNSIYMLKKYPCGYYVVDISEV